MHLTGALVDIYCASYPAPPVNIGSTTSRYSSIPGIVRFQFTKYTNWPATAEWPAFLASSVPDLHTM
jgi:hypothetical protein